jgi:hypothetical protein
MTAPRPEDYHPYDTFPEFREGYTAYGRNEWQCPHNSNSAAAQAWDRGLEYAMRLACWNRRGA